MKKVTISGNYREKFTDEWAGDGIMRDGYIECSADMPSEVYDIVECSIQKGLTNGSITVEEPGVDWPVTYHWSILD